VTPTTPPQSNRLKFSRRLPTALLLLSALAAVIVVLHSAYGGLPEAVKKNVAVCQALDIWSPALVASGRPWRHPELTDAAVQLRQSPWLPTAVTAMEDPWLVIPLLPAHDTAP
jgi:hypothetical protein